MAKKTYTISNIAGGDERVFSWTGSISDAALRHSEKASRGFGVTFGGEAGNEAREAYEAICEEETANV